jgi:hypothetical protein
MELSIDSAILRFIEESEMEEWMMWRGVGLKGRW